MEGRVQTPLFRTIRNLIAAFGNPSDDAPPLPCGKPTH
jgi:hypothetical protein